MANAQLKIKQANKKWRHEHKRRQKAFAEKKRRQMAVETQGRIRNERKQAARAYVGALGADLD